jgi:hypothetical protein
VLPVLERTRRGKGAGDNRAARGGQDVFRQEKISDPARASEARARLRWSPRLRTWPGGKPAGPYPGVPVKHGAGLAREGEISRQLRRYRAVTDHGAARRGCPSGHLTASMIWV